MDNFTGKIIDIPGSVMTFNSYIDPITQIISLSSKVSNLKPHDENAILAKSFGCLECKIMFKHGNVYRLKVEKDSLNEQDRKNISYVKLPTGSDEKYYYILEM